MTCWRPPAGHPHSLALNHPSSHPHRLALNPQTSHPHRLPLTPPFKQAIHTVYHPPTQPSTSCHPPTQPAIHRVYLEQQRTARRGPIPALERSCVTSPRGISRTRELIIARPRGVPYPKTSRGALTTLSFSANHVLASNSAYSSRTIRNVSRACWVISCQTHPHRLTAQPLQPTLFEA